MAQKKPAGKPIKITLTEAQISDIIQRAAKTRRSVRVESLEDRIAPSRIGLPVFGGAEDLDKLDDAAPAPLEGEIFPEGTGPDGLPEVPDAFGDSDPLDDPKDGGLEEPTDPFQQTILTEPDPNLLPPDNPILPGDEPVDPNVIITEDNPDAPPGVEIVGGDEQPTLDEAANVEFNENLHMQGDTVDSGLTQDEMEEHRLNILRQLRGS